jgi:hypothetical protein
MLKYVKLIIDLCLKFITNDPNYNYNDDNDMNDDSMEFDANDDEK